MDLTATKKRYLLSIALLKDHPQQTFRPIELAIRLGVSRASVSRMILSFVKTGLLAQNRHGYRLTQRAAADDDHCSNMNNTSIFILLFFISVNMMHKNAASHYCHLPKHRH